MLLTAVLPDQRGCCCAVHHHSRSLWLTHLYKTDRLAQTIHALTQVVAAPLRAHTPPLPIAIVAATSVTQKDPYHAAIPVWLLLHRHQTTTTRLVYRLVPSHSLLPIKRTRVRSRGIRGGDGVNGRRGHVFGKANDVVGGQERADAALEAKRVRGNGADVFATRGGRGMVPTSQPQPRVYQSAYVPAATNPLPPFLGVAEWHVRGSCFCHSKSHSPDVAFRDVDNAVQWRGGHSGLCRWRVPLHVVGRLSALVGAPGRERGQGPK